MLAGVDQLMLPCVSGGEEGRLFPGDQELGCVNEECCHLLASMNIYEERLGVWMPAFYRQLCLEGLLLASLTSLRAKVGKSG